MNKDLIFCCPKCAGLYFGTNNANQPVEQWIRCCHDQYGVGCNWKGGSAEGMMRPAAAVRMISRKLALLHQEIRNKGDRS